MRSAALLAAMLALGGAGPALSEPGASGGSDQTQICTDRPTKADSPCTVPVGHFQIESDVADGNRSSGEGVTTRSLLVINPTFKYGVAEHLDVELNLSPWQQVRTTSAGRTVTDASLSDLTLRVKWEPIAGEAYSLAFIPFVDLPTASHDIGAGRIEGGILAPMNIALPAKFALTLEPQLAALANEDRPGVHVNLINLASLSRPLGQWTLYAEIWNQQAFEPEGTIAQTTADVAVSYLVNPTLQLDAGADFGLDRAAPHQQYYFGVSHRF